MEEGDFHTQHLEGNPLYWLGPPLEKGAMDTFFFFAISGKKSLLTPPLNQVPKLIQKNLQNARIFSLDLPFHKDSLPQKSSLQMLKDSLAQGDDSFFVFLQSCLNAVKYLKENKLITPNDISASGISRGGFAALHFAAAIAETKNVLVFSPLINPFLNKKLENLSLDSVITKLLRKNIRIHVGNKDEIVHTSECASFAQHLIDANDKERIKPIPVELHLYPSIGYKGHGTHDASFLEGANWLLRLV